VCEDECNEWFCRRGCKEENDDELTKKEFGEWFCPERKEDTDGRAPVRMMQAWKKDFVKNGRTRRQWWKRNTSDRIGSDVVAGGRKECHGERFRRERREPTIVGWLVDEEGVGGMVRSRMEGRQQWLAGVKGSGERCCYEGRSAFTRIKWTAKHLYCSFVIKVYPNVIHTGVNMYSHLWRVDGRTIWWTILSRTEDDKRWQAEREKERETAMFIIWMVKTCFGIFFRWGCVITAHNEWWTTVRRYSLFTFGFLLEIVTLIEGEEMICRPLINTPFMAHILLFSICLTAPLLWVEKIDSTLRKKTVYLYRYVSSSIRMNRLDWIHTFSPTDGVYGVLYRMHVLSRH